MPNGDSQEYVIKTDGGDFRILADKGMPQDKVLTMAAATNPKFALHYAQSQARMQGAPMMEQAWQTHEAKRELLEGRQQRAIRSTTPVTDAASVLMTPILGAERLPNVVSAGEKFSNVAAAMEKIPVSVKQSKAAAEGAARVISHGGKTSKLITDFMSATAEGDALSWKTAREFLSNASSRTWLGDLFEGQTGYARHAIGEFVGELGNEIKAAAKSAGQGETYASAMKEYRNAMRISRALKASLIAGGTYAFTKLTSGQATAYVKKLASSLE